MDLSDEADEYIQNAIDKAIADARRAAALIPPGVPGDCRTCGEPSPRLVGGRCARCRDRRPVEHYMDVDDDG